MLWGSLGIDVIVPLERFLGGLVAVFAGEAAGFRSQAMGQAGLVGSLPPFGGGRAVAFAAIVLATSDF